MLIYAQLLQTIMVNQLQKSVFFFAEKILTNMLTIYLEHVLLVVHQEHMQINSLVDA